MKKDEFLKLKVMAATTIFSGRLDTIDEWENDDFPTMREWCLKQAQKFIDLVKIEIEEYAENGEGELYD